jgi:thiamine pyrophosphokinase
MPAEERVQQESVIVVAGGGAVPVHASLPAGAPVVAADQGLDSALAAGLHVDVAVGDFDSASPAALAAAATAGTRVVRHPSAKDATDLELALDEAAALGRRRIMVVGGADGRLDHLLAGLLLLGAERYAQFEIDAVLGRATAHVVRDERRLEGEAGELVSLLALHGPAAGVVTEGLAYPLRGETLRPGSSRGVSNVFVATDARIAVERGVLVAVRPGPAARSE